MKLFKRKLSAKQKAALNRLADGIECGAKLRPQTQNKLFGKTEAGEYGSCALGAAWECAVQTRGKSIDLPEIDLYSMSYQQIMKTYGVTTRARMLTIEIEGREIVDGHTEIDDVIVRLNDWLLWSRERIAQFLREVE